MEKKPDLLREAKTSRRGRGGYRMGTLSLVGRKDRRDPMDSLLPIQETMGQKLVGLLLVCIQRFMKEEGRERERL